ncbi:MAG TPA: UbiD family decarboxylase [bacterium]|nr:UbiD family decarboxylase [bacterium]
MSEHALSFSRFVENLSQTLPEELLSINAPVDPSQFDATGLLAALERQKSYPMVVFEKPANLFGRPSDFLLAANIFASRKRCAVALGLSPNDWRLEVSLRYAERERARLQPSLVERAAAPVCEHIYTGEQADLRMFPMVRHHHMDGGPYIDMAVLVKDLDGGFYNAAFLRTMYQEPRQLGIYMSPRHSWFIHQKYVKANLDMPVCLVVNHHPSFYLGALNVAPFGEDDYQVIGSVMGQPLRLTPSTTWGADFLIPADADVIVEGYVPPDKLEVEGPFGEFPGTYGPEVLKNIVRVTAIAHKKRAACADIFVGHVDNWILGAVPKEGSLYNRIRGAVPSVQAVHLPNSGTGRFNCYISLRKRVEGESKQAALVAMGECDFVKNVIVVDDDIDVFNEEEVMWALATRVQADQDVDILKNVKGNNLDPSQTHDILTAKMIIDATKPVDRDFAERIKVPEEAILRGIRLLEQLDRGPRHD